MKKTIEMEGADNSVLVGDFFDNPDSNKGIILMPGLSEHRSSLHDLAEKLSQKYKTWTFDPNSQGDSTGTWQLQEIADSIDKIAREVKKETWTGENRIPRQ